MRSLAALAAVASTLSVHPAVPRAGARLVVRVAPVSAPARVCLEPVTGSPRCATVAPDDRRVARAAFVAPYPGEWRATASAGTRQASRVVRLLPRGERLVLLVAGDSLARSVTQGMRRLRAPGVVVHGDINPGRALTKADGFDWLGHAREMIARLRPDVVAVFVGTNDGWPIGSVSCCGSDWVGLLAERQRAVMQAYADAGTARVYWSTLWAPGVERLEPIWASVNSAVTAAVAPDHARVFDAAALFSPGFVFQPSFARDADGIHLSRAGGLVAADALLAQLRADRILTGS